MDDNNNPIIIRPHIVFTDGRQPSWLGCHCRPSVNTICGRVMIGLSLSSVSKHNMWSCYDWVVEYDHILCLLTDDNDNPIIIHPHIVFIDEDNNDNSIIIRLHIVFTDGQLGLSLLLSVSKHNMWSYYDWVYCRCLPSVNTICGRIMTGFNDNNNKTSHNTTTYCVYWRTTTTIKPVIIRRLLLSSVSKHNMWSYYDWVVVVVVRQ
jgi:hypothetical protein